MEVSNGGEAGSGDGKETGGDRCLEADLTCRWTWLQGAAGGAVGAEAGSGGADGEGFIFHWREQQK